MRTGKVMYFTKKEEEFANFLMAIGMKRNIAVVMTFLANTPEASSKDIQRGTDLRQSGVRRAMRYLSERSWVTGQESRLENKGRPVRVYRLSRPFHEIMDSLENQKKNEATSQSALIQKLQTYLR
jgi:predicted transcriptional regulator